MFEKGRVKWTKTHLPSLLERMCLCPFDERSEPEKPKVFRVSALYQAEIRFFGSLPCTKQRSGFSGL
ncbi:MAG: hypothetical protein NC548_21815, partial [Lachnospiraceae bacterium]|nr:hypothetical protein [Lachnospiraceae bacterium]